jgi:hypothetical protein
VSYKEFINYYRAYPYKFYEDFYGMRFNPMQKAIMKATVTRGNSKSKTTLMQNILKSDLPYEAQRELLKAIWVLMKE